MSIFLRSMKHILTLVLGLLNTCEFMAFQTDPRTSLTFHMTLEESIMSFLYSLQRLVDKHVSASLIPLYFHDTFLPCPIAVWKAREQVVTTIFARVLPQRTLQKSMQVGILGIIEHHPEIYESQTQLDQMAWNFEFITLRTVGGQNAVDWVRSISKRICN